MLMTIMTAIQRDNESPHTTVATYWSKVSMTETGEAASSGRGGGEGGSVSRLKLSSRTLTGKVSVVFWRLSSSSKPERQTKHL